MEPARFDEGTAVTKNIQAGAGGRYTPAPPTLPASASDHPPAPSRRDAARSGALPNGHAGAAGVPIGPEPKRMHCRPNAGNPRPTHSRDQAPPYGFPLRPSAVQSE